MSDKILSKISDDVEIIKTFFILFLRKQGITNKEVANSLGISEGRLSQILNPSKYKKGKKSKDS